MPKAPDAKRATERAMAPIYVCRRSEAMAATSLLVSFCNAIKIGLKTCVTAG